MSKEPTRVTRKEVYELIWTRPIHQLATEWGLSDVGLAKILKGMSIPRPGRGYWARIAAGQKPRRTPLPRNAEADEHSIVVHRSPLADRPKAEHPVVSVPDKLVDPHEVTRWISLALAKATLDKYGRERIGDRYQNPFCVSRAQRDRALRILDSLAKALAERGCPLTVGRRFPDWEPSEMVINVEDEAIPLEIEEQLDSRPYVPTSQERREQAKRPWISFPSQHHIPSGRLALRLAHAPHRYRKRKWWRDDGEQRLEDQLGRAIVGIEEVVYIATIEGRERKEQAHLRMLEERRRLRAERLDWYKHSLVRDLDAMIGAWERAQKIRVFLGEYERRLPADAQNECAKTWQAAVARYADRIDPLCDAARIAKELEPDDDTLERLIAAEKERR